MPLTSTIKASISGSYTSTIDLGTAEMPFNVAAAIALATGTGANQADKFWSDTRTLTTGATDSLDLAGSLTDVFGATITLARVKAIILKSSASNTTDLQIARPAANGVALFAAASDAITIKPGGLFCWCCPDATAIPVTAGTGDLLSIINAAGASATYDIAIVGSSA